jgi:hypothetical protein
MTNTKICPKCSKEKSFDCFYKSRNTKDRLRCYCKPCGIKQDKERKKRYAETNSVPSWSRPETSICSKCKIEKKGIEFTLAPTKSGLKNNCTSCETQHRLLREYGIDLDQYVEMLKSQNHLCAICGQPETTKQNGEIKKLSIDHNHTTGEVRELLCTNCNTSLGGFKDDLAILKSAIEYLKKHN